MTCLDWSCYSTGGAASVAASFGAALGDALVTGVSIGLLIVVLTLFYGRWRS